MDGAKGVCQRTDGAWTHGGGSHAGEVPMAKRMPQCPVAWSRSVRVAPGKVNHDNARFLEPSVSYE